MSKKYLIGIPCLHGVDHTREAIESAVNDDADVLVIDNGADEGVKKVIYSFGDQIKVIRNEKNVFVNPAWNQVIEYFLNGEYQNLVIMNSDAIIPSSWCLELDKFYARYFQDIPVPHIQLDKRFAWNDQDPAKSVLAEPLVDGIAGICICLTRQQVKWIYPIPDGIKVWFGDNWIYETLRQVGCKTWKLHNLEVYHAVSQNVSIAHGVYDQIEIDKAWWEENGETKKNEQVQSILASK